jgi:ABC-type methionine transport system ATPase subunit
MISGSGNMVKKFVKLTFPQHLITEPIIYNMGKRFNVVTNIFRADVDQYRGGVVLQLEGKARDVKGAITWAREKGVTVELASEDVLLKEGRVSC